MKSSDITQVILVILVFVGVMFANMASAGVENIKKNWPAYRCNPGIMPFAGTFGHDPLTNFSDCISTMQMSSMSFLTAPFSFNMGVLTGGTGQGGGLGGSLTGSANASRGMHSNTRSSLGGMVQSIMGVFLNLIIAMQRLLVNLKDLFSKLVGIIATVLFFVKTAVIGLQAVWAGPPGQLIRGLCFDPLTCIRLEDDTVKPIGALKPGCRLKNGVRVCAVMDIDNTDEEGRQVELMYSLPGGESGQPILVSGSHLVYRPEKEEYIPVRDLDATAGASMDNTACPHLACLITSDHTIPIGEWVFHDWEDNVGSRSKSIG
jgi:hypothetical protein